MATQPLPYTPLPDFSQLPFLLRLIDDPSPPVREKIAARLRELGADVWPEIERQQLPLSNSQRELLQKILAPVAKSENDWLDWLQCERETEQLEAALGWLSGQFSQNLTPPAKVQLRLELDLLAQEYSNRGGAPDPEELSHFLFREKGLRGAEGDHYYAPENSDLLWVLQNKCGLPISLACVFILVAARLDMEIVGCEFPGHFLARAPMDDEWNAQENADLVFDCHDAGRVLQPFEVDALRKSAPDALSTPATARSIVARVLRNFATAYHVQGNRAATLRHLHLLQQLEAATI